MKFTVSELIKELECYEGDKVVWIKMDYSEAPVRLVQLDEEDDKIVLK